MSTTGLAQRVRGAIGEAQQALLSAADTPEGAEAAEFLGPEAEAAVEAYQYRRLLYAGGFVALAVVLIIVGAIMQAAGASATASTVTYVLAGLAGVGALYFFYQHWAN
jgi:hypothetical protein